MYTDKKHGHVLIVIAILLVLLAGIVWRVKASQNSYRQQILDSIRKNVMDSALQCYVVEGAYPPSLKYLEENYGLTLNKEDYYIHYEIFAENVPPDVRVTYRMKDR